MTYGSSFPSSKHYRIFHDHKIIRIYDAVEPAFQPLDDALHPSHPYGRLKRHGDFAPVRSPRLRPAAPLPDRSNEDEQDENEEKEGGVWVT